MPRTHLRLAVDNSKKQPEPIAVVFYRSRKKRTAGLQHAVWFPMPPSNALLQKALAVTSKKFRNSQARRGTRQQVVYDYDDQGHYVFFYGGLTEATEMVRVLNSAGINTQLQHINAEQLPETIMPPRLNLCWWPAQRAS